MDGFRRMFGSVASIRRITSLYPPYRSSVGWLPSWPGYRHPCRYDGVFQL